MSMPYTSQSVVSRMRLERWCPIKPFTPSINTFFIFISLTIKFESLCAKTLREFRRAHCYAIQFKAYHAQHTLPADRISLAFLDVERGLLSRCRASRYQRLQNTHVLRQLHTAFRR